MNNFKELLREANRYEDVLGLLVGISHFKDDTDGSYPVNLFHSYDGKYKYRVAGKDLKSQARTVIEIIDEEIDLQDVREENLFFEDIQNFVESYTDTLLHNYSVALSHGQSPEKEDMNAIRIWEILNSLIYTIMIYDDEWDIPEGWKIKE